MAPFTLIYSIVTFSSYQKGARKNCYLLKINEVTYSNLLDICQERGVPPGVAKNIVETKYNSINLAVQKIPEFEKNSERAKKICEIYYHG
jgi:hypothetical protein